MTRKEACYFLGVKENASCEQIKKAYRYKAKLYHPDSNPANDTNEHYIKLQKAYEYLLANPYVPPQPVPNVGFVCQTPQAPTRPAKIFATSDAARSSYKKQKEMASEHEKIEKWDKDYRKGQLRQQQRQKYDMPKKSMEEEIIDKIKTIWIAENIRRQIEKDKEQKEMLQRRKLYKAFMQQKMQDNDN